MASEIEIALEHGAQFRRCFVAGDIAGLGRLWAHVAPHLACSSDAELEVSFHMARSGAKSVPDNLRQYSDRWLRERGIGSLLPAHLIYEGWKVRG
jgi:hypothetical protein